MSSSHNTYHVYAWKTKRLITLYAHIQVIVPEYYYFLIENNVGLKQCTANFILFSRDGTQYSSVGTLTQFVLTF